MAANGARLVEDYPGKPGSKPRPLADRLWAKTAFGDWLDCWRWQGHIAPTGYGTIGAGGKYGDKLLVHRVSYELLVGPIPEGLEIDHLCRNRACLNPLHLEAVTPRENVRRGALVALKTHCAQGHPWTTENVVRRKRYRTCRICERTRNAEARARRRGN